MSKSIFVMFRDMPREQSVAMATRIQQRTIHRQRQHWSATAIQANVDGLRIESPGRKAMR
jgi:hypothetical protein